MKWCVDAAYRKGHSVIAGVGFINWEDAEAAAQQVTTYTLPAAEYQPGQFYQRELPGLLHLVAQLSARPTLLVVDGYVWLGGGRPGLGGHLFRALGEQVPVVGVAKTRFRSADGATEVLRGHSRRPLWVTAGGMGVDEAAHLVRQMHGAHRIPVLLRLADRLCRER